MRVSGTWALKKVGVFRSSYGRDAVMANDLTVLVVGASVEEFTHVKGCLSDRECVSVPLNDEETAVSSIPAAAKLIIVYARKNERNTLAICEQLRNSPESSAAPILLVISRYEIIQANAVRCMGNATFIISPFDEKGLRNKITELLGGP